MCMVTGAVTLYTCITVKGQPVRGQEGYCQYVFGDRGCHPVHVYYCQGTTSQGSGGLLSIRVW